MYLTLELQGMANKSFMFAAATPWNDLPNHFRTENSFNHFYKAVIYIQLVNAI
jgi:hypothetical protein